MKKLVLGVLVAASLLTTQAFADNYSIDPVHSTVGFSVKHMMVSEVQGQFDKFEGTIAFDAANLAASKANVTVQVASINTHVEKRDAHLKTGDFFDAEKNPTITFVSKSFAKKGDDYVITGDLTMKGVTKEVSVPVTISGPVDSPMGGTLIGIVGSTTIDRQAYGISWNKTMDKGGVVVGNDVKLNISLECKKI